MESDQNHPYIQGAIKIDYFPSVNSMYIHKHKRLILAPEWVQVRNYAFSQLSIHSPSQLIPKKGKLGIELGFFLSHSINRRDLDNCLKFTIDTLAEYYHFNDNRITTIITFKRELIGIQKEILYYKIFADVGGDRTVNYTELLGEEKSGL